jgi:hypothetical protein
MGKEQDPAFQLEPQNGIEILTVTPDIIIINISLNYEIQNRYDPLQSSPTGDSTQTCRRYFLLLLCW